MGNARDFLKQVSMLSSAGLVISDAGLRLLELKDKLGAGKAKTPNAAAGKKKPESNLERKRRLSRESMQRFRERKKNDKKYLEKRRKWARDAMRRMRAKRKAAIA